jgi:hypothetical protein
MNRLVFNTFSVPTGNSYQLENSYAAFSRQRAAVLGPVKLDQTGSLQEQREPAPRLGPRHPQLLDAAVVAHRCCIAHRERGTP